MSKKPSYQRILDSIYSEVEDRAWTEFTTEDLKNSFQLLLAQWRFDQRLKLLPWEDWERDLNTKLAVNCKTTILEVCKKVLCNTMKLEGVGFWKKYTTEKDVEEFITKVLKSDYSLDDVIVLYSLYSYREIFTSRDFYWNDRVYIEFYKNDKDRKLSWIEWIESPVITAVWIENLKNMDNQCIEAISPQYSWKARYPYEVAAKVQKIWSRNLAKMNKREIEVYMWIHIDIWSEFTFEQMKKHWLEKIMIISNLSEEKKEFATTDKLLYMTIEQLNNYAKVDISIVKEVWLTWIWDLTIIQVNSWRLSPTEWIF